MEETKIFYHIDEEDTPYLMKLPIPPDKITLGDFKNALNRSNTKFFFKSVDAHFGVVKEEIADDNAHLPCSEGRVESWLVTADADGSVHSDAHHDGLGQGAAAAAAAAASSAGARSAGGNDQDTDSESVYSAKQRGDRVAPLRSSSDYKKHANRINAGRYHPRHPAAGVGQDGQTATYESASSMLSSDLDTTSFVDSEDDSSQMSGATTTTYSLNRPAMPNRKNRKIKRRPPMSRTSSFSSITESTMSLNVQTVELDMESVQFLGISIVGQPPVNGSSGGIYVGSIMRGGAVELEGTIQPGDMLLEVNGIGFESLENDEAVRILREQVQKPGKITLVVAKCWDSRDYLKVPREEPVRPIDPRAWVMHTNAMRQNQSTVTPAGSIGGDNLCDSRLTVTAASVSTSSCSLPESERYTADELMPPLTVRTDLLTIAKAMAQPESGLEVRDRTWLKITIPKAFIGSDLVDWLFHRVVGFSERKEARKFAVEMLKQGHIKHTVNKVSFSEQCYYVFGDSVAQQLLLEAPVHAMSNLSLMENLENLSGVSHEGIVPMAPQLGQFSVPPGAVAAASAAGRQPPPFVGPPPPSYNGLYGPDSESVSQYSSLQTKTHLGQMQPHAAVISDNSDSSSASSRSRRSVSLTQQSCSQTGHHPGLSGPNAGGVAPVSAVSSHLGVGVGGVGSAATAGGAAGGNAAAVAAAAQRDLTALSSDIKASKQSFRMAMNNPC